MTMDLSTAADDERDGIVADEPEHPAATPIDVLGALTEQVERRVQFETIVRSPRRRSTMRFTFDCQLSARELQQAQLQAMPPAMRKRAQINPMAVDNVKVAALVLAKTNTLIEVQLNGVWQPALDPSPGVHGPLVFSDKVLQESQGCLDTTSVVKKFYGGDEGALLEHFDEVITKAGFGDDDTDGMLDPT